MPACPIRLACLVALALPPTAYAAEQTHRHHGPHVHGEATLNVGVDGQLLLVSLEAPGMSLLGYEHPPRDEADRAAYEKTIATLNAPADWLVLPAAAGCALDDAKVAPHGFGTGTSDAKADDDDDDEPAGHEHADFDASYRYTCHAPLALRAFDVKLLERFPSLHKVNVDLVLPDRQGSQALTSGTTTALLSK